MITTDVMTTFVCPECHKTLVAQNEVFVCSGCQKEFADKRGVVDFRAEDEYWCNVDRAKMQRLNKTAKETGDWFAAAKDIIPEYADHFIPLYRADAQFLWPTDQNSRILDAGSMWGGVSLAAAQFHGEVYAVDKTVETLEFLKIRAAQMGLSNISTCAASIKALPFEDGFFDCVVLNGVLEWVGLEGDMILEKQWNGKWEQTKQYSKTPRQMQMDVLQELRRVLKPGGALYIAIENRYGIQYFLTYPDDHNNVRFVPFLPRSWANIISKLCGKGEYRTYVYSPKQLSHLLEESGFTVNSMYGVSPHYIKIKKAYPLDMAGLFKYDIEAEGTLPKIFHMCVKPLMPRSLIATTSPSLFAVCSKDAETKIIPRLQKVLINAGVLADDEKVKLVFSNNRFENYHSANVIVYDEENYPLYFCKIARNRQVSGLKEEAKNLTSLIEKLKTSVKENFELPGLVYYGELDGLEVLVTRFVQAKNLNLRFHYIMNKGLDRIRLTWKLLRKMISAIEEKCYLNKVNEKMIPAIDALLEFQRSTSGQKSDFKSVVPKNVNDYIQSQKTISPELLKGLHDFENTFSAMPSCDIDMCAVHGDYDFDNVLFSLRKKIALVDFEHSQQEGSLFFDLASLVFHPFIIKWKAGYLKDQSFDQYLSAYGIKPYIVQWLRYFCDKAGLLFSVIEAIPVIGVLEHNMKKYPQWRDPYTFPMYGEEMIREMLALNLKG